MLSFLTRTLEKTKAAVVEANDDDPPSTTNMSSSSAYEFKGGRKVKVPKDTTCLLVDPSAKHLDGRINYGHLFSIELPPTPTLRMDVNLTLQGTSCLPPSKIVQAVSTLISDSKMANTSGGDVFKSESLRHLRNIAFPPTLDERNLPSFDNSSDLGKINLPSKRNRSVAFSFLCNGYALRSRFEGDGLRVHRACYYHSYHHHHHYHGVEVDQSLSSLDQSSEVVLVLRNLLVGGDNNNNNDNHPPPTPRGATIRPPSLQQQQQQQRHSQHFVEQDCLGFTPLHILTCSTQHHVEMYELLIEHYPHHLITEDKWGDIPLLYALWGRAPRVILDLLTGSMRKYHSNYQVDWVNMIQTFCEALAPTSCLEYLIKTARENFPEQQSSTMAQLQSMNVGRMVGILCVEAKASVDHVERFIDTYCRTMMITNNNALLPHNESDVADNIMNVRTSRDFYGIILRRKFGFQPFWLKIPISKRISSLPKREWRERLETMIYDECPTGSSERVRWKRVELTENLLDRLDLYEWMEKMWAVELALWKMKIEEADDDDGDDDDGGDDEDDGNGDDAEGGRGNNNRDYRSQCRITTGADVIVPYVMSYLRSEFSFSADGHLSMHQPHRR